MTRRAVVVCGGGPAGLATSIHLARAGLDVMLVERGDFDGIRVGEHVSARGARLLGGLGLDLAQAACAAQCTEVRSVWGSAEVRTVDSFFDPDGPGHLVARPAFDRALADLAAAAGVSVRPRCSIADVEARDSVWRLVLRSGPREAPVEEYAVAADFVVDATGRPALVARRLGARSAVVDGLAGVCGFLDAPLDPTYSVLVEATTDGWWYSASPPGGAGVATLMMDADALGGGERPERLWTEALRATVHTRARVESAQATLTEVAVRPAFSHCLDRFGGEAWLAVGDSALSYDPLSSAGIEKALAHGLSGARAIVAWSGGDDGPLRACSESNRTEFDRYLRDRARTYDTERRWSTAPFWERRHSS